MRLSLSLLLSLLSLSLGAQQMRLVKATSTREVTASKKLLEENYLANFEKRSAQAFIIDSVKTIAGNKKLSYDFYLVQMEMSKEDVQWSYLKEFKPEAQGLFQLRIRKRPAGKNIPAANETADLSKGFVIYAREEGKPVELKVERIDALPDVEQR